MVPVFFDFRGHYRFALVFLIRTDTGKSIRATAQDLDAALLMGVNVSRMRAATFGIGCALVGAAGCLFLPIYYLFPSLGGQFTLIAFVITILGGLGSTNGAIIGGVILGIFESMTATYLGMGWAPVGRFLIFVAALIFLPGGVASLLLKQKARKMKKSVPIIIVILLPRLFYPSLG